MNRYDTLLQNATDITAKCDKSLLQNAAVFFTKCDSFITNCGDYMCPVCYYKMRRFLQIATVEAHIPVTEYTINFTVNYYT